MSPDLILADEPTGNLDWDMSMRLLQLLIELNRSGKAVVIATHDLNLIRAAKQQVQDMVVRLLKLEGAPSSDAADALACAICHAHGGQGLGAMATAGYRVRGGSLIR